MRFSVEPWWVHSPQLIPRSHACAQGCGSVTQEPLLAADSPWWSPKKSFLSWAQQAPLRSWERTDLVHHPSTLTRPGQKEPGSTQGGAVLSPHQGTHRDSAGRRQGVWAPRWPTSASPLKPLSVQRQNWALRGGIPKAEGSVPKAEEVPPPLGPL